MPAGPSPTSRTSRREIVFAAPLLAGIAAAMGPVGLTGYPVIDAFEAFAIAASCTLVGAYGRRWAWIVAAGLVTVPARGSALLLAIAALAVLVPAAIPRRRHRDLGAAGLALAVNVPFWYGSETPAYAPFLAFAAFGLLLWSGRPFLQRRHRRLVAVGLGSALAILGLAVVGAGITLLQSHTSITRASSDAQAALDAARRGDAAAARSAVKRAQQELDDAEAHVDGIGTAPARLVPGLAQQMHAIRVAVHEGNRITETASDLVRTADYDALTYDGQIDLRQVERLQGPSRRTAGRLATAGSALDDARRGWLLPPLQDRLDDFARKVTDAHRDTALASDILDVVPALFGGEGDRRYLVAFVTPAELRGAGGFIGSYAELTATGGDVELSRSGRILDLILAAKPGERKITGPADYVRRYGHNDPQDYIQDVTFSPNFPSDASVLAQLYPQSGGQPVDGVISVDPRGLAALLELTGPITVPGLPEQLTADNAEEVLLRSQYVDLPDEAARGDILTEATRITFDRLTNGKLPGPRRIAEALSGPTRGGHLRLWSPEEAEQGLFEQLGADGTLRLPKGDDGFSVVQQNAGNNKLDAYLRRSIDYQATVNAETGELEGTVTIDLHNDAPALDLPRAVVGNSRGAPVGTNLATLSLFTRHDLVSATIDGKPADLGPGREQGLNAYDSPILRIPPGGTTRLVLHLKGGVDLSDGYDLRILPQPTAIPDRVKAALTVRNGTAEGGRKQVTLVDTDAIAGPTTRHVGVNR